MALMKLTTLLLLCIFSPLVLYRKSVVKFIENHYNKKIENKNVMHELENKALHSKQHIKSKSKENEKLRDESFKLEENEKHKNTPTLGADESKSLKLTTKKSFQQKIKLQTEKHDRVKRLSIFARASMVPLKIKMPIPMDVPLPPMPPLPVAMPLSQVMPFPMPMPMQYPLAVQQHLLAPMPMPQQMQLHMPGLPQMPMPMLIPGPQAIPRFMPMLGPQPVPVPISMTRPQPIQMPSSQPVIVFNEQSVDINKA